MLIFCVYILEYPEIKEEVHTLDYVLFPVLIATSQTVPIVYLQFIPRHEDPLSFILDHILADSPVHRTGGIFITVPLLLIRATFLFGYAEVLRMWTLAITLLEVIISNAKNCLALLGNENLSCKDVVRHYKQVYLLYAITADVLMQVATIVITAVFCICVIEIVVVIELQARMETAMYLSIVLSGGVVLLVFYIILDQISIFTEIAENILLKTRRTATEQYALAKTRSSRKEWKGIKMESMTLKRIQVGYFGDMSVDRKFMVDVLDNLAERVADLLILI